MTKASPSVKISVPSDVRTLYSDSVIVHSNKFGLTLDFAQSMGPRQQQVVSRIGMSREHAKAFVQVLARHLQKKPQKPAKTIIQ